MNNSLESSLYSEKQASLAAAFAGPIPPGLLIFLNYYRLGNKKAAFLSLTSTLIITCALSYLILLIPEDTLDKIPSLLFTSVFGLIVYGFFQLFMTKIVNQSVKDGYKIGSNWFVAGLSLIGMVINFGILFLIAYSQPIYDSELLNINGNELYYDNEIEESEVNKLSSQLESKGFFEKDLGNIARLQSTNEGYLITLVINENYWSDQELIEFASNLKWLMELEFGKTTSLQFETFLISGDSKFKKIDS